MTRILTIWICLILVSCGTNQSNRGYSEEFFEYFRNSKIELRKDSLLFPEEAGNEIVLIPTILRLNQNYYFYCDNGLELRVKRTNYTDLDFELKDNGGQIDKGTASLRPTFHLGAESVGTSEGEFWVTDYEVEKSNCIWTLCIGDQQLTDKQPRDIFVYVLTKSDCKSEKTDNCQEFWEQKNM